MIRLDLKTTFVVSFFSLKLEKNRLMLRKSKGFFKANWTQITVEIVMIKCQQSLDTFFRDKFAASAIASKSSDSLKVK